MENTHIREMTPIGENQLPDRGHLPYLGPKNLTKLKCAKNGAKSGCFDTSIVLLTQKNTLDRQVTEEEKKITVVVFQKR